MPFGQDSVEALDRASWQLARTNLHRQMSSRVSYAMHVLAGNLVGVVSGFNGFGRNGFG
jgi:hypothetical protein